MSAQGRGEALAVLTALHGGDQSIAMEIVSEQFAPDGSVDACTRRFAEHLLLWAAWFGSCLQRQRAAHPTSDADTRVPRAAATELTVPTVVLASAGQYGPLALVAINAAVQADPGTAQRTLAGAFASSSAAALRLLLAIAHLSVHLADELAQARGTNIAQLLAECGLSSAVVPDRQR